MTKKQVTMQTRGKWTYICPKCYVVFKEKAVNITPNTQNRNEIQKALKQIES